MGLLRGFWLGTVWVVVACGGAVEPGTDASTRDGATDAGIDPDALPVCLESLAAWCARMGCFSPGPSGEEDMPRWCATAGAFGKRVIGVANCPELVELEVAVPGPGPEVAYYHWYDRTTGSLVAITDGPARVCYAGTAPRHCMNLGVGWRCP